jgi:hypothetical protein
LPLGRSIPQIGTFPIIQNSVKFTLSAKIKEELRNSVSAKVVWEGVVEINKTVYYA